MAKTRSPGYPAIGLKEAVDRISDIYKKDYQNPISRKTAAAHMGYKSLNGKSLGVLSALSKFGLLEGRGDNTRASDLSVAIIAHSTGTPERAAAIKEAAGNPDLFKELDERYQAGRASDQAIRSYLLTQKFIPSAADAVLRSYRETKQFAEGDSVGCDSTKAETLKEPGPATDQPQSRVGSATASPRSGDFRRVALVDDRLEGSFSLRDPNDVDKLIRALEANKVLLNPIQEPLVTERRDDEYERGT